MTDPMAPVGLEFHPVSQKLALVRIISSMLGLLPVLIASVVAARLLTPLFWIAFAVLVCVSLWDLWFISRQVKAMAFALAGDEFCIRKGIMFRRLTLIPYGRIQYIEISEGPIARMFGIAEIKVHTASAHTDATLNGVPVDEAVRLRDMLAERGSAELAGL